MTPPDDAEAVAAQQKLEALRERFAVRLRERVDALVAAVDAVLQGDGDIQHAHTLAHKLSGSAGSYGFIKAGEHAAELQRILEVDPPDPKALREQTEHLVATLPRT